MNFIKSVFYRAKVGLIFPNTKMKYKIPPGQVLEATRPARNKLLKFNYLKGMVA